MTMYAVDDKRNVMYEVVPGMNRNLKPGQKATDDEIISAYRVCGNVWVAAKELGMCGQSVHERLVKLGVINKPPRFTPYECHVIMAWYTMHHGKPMDLDALAEQLGHKHHKTNICRKAKELGLSTSQTRPLTTKQKKDMSERSSKQMCRNIHTGAAKSGRRDDLDGMFFRSRWEANYARFLNLLVSIGEIASWEYEPKTFVFTNITRGPWSYLPDFRVNFKDGGYEYVEIKGWMDSSSRSKIKRFKAQFPSEKLVVFAKKEYDALEAEHKDTIPGWEMPVRVKGVPKD